MYGEIIFVFYLYIHILFDAEPWLCYWCQKSQIRNGTLKKKRPLRIWKIHPAPPGGGAYLSCLGWGEADRHKLSVLHGVDMHRETRTAALTGQSIYPWLYKASYMPGLHDSHHWRAASTKVLSFSRTNQLHLRKVFIAYACIWSLQKKDILRFFSLTFDNRIRENSLKTHKISLEYQLNAILIVSYLAGISNKMVEIYIVDICQVKW